MIQKIEKCMKSMNYYTIYQQAAAVILGQQLQWLGGCMYVVVHSGKKAECVVVSVDARQLCR